MKCNFIDASTTRPADTTQYGAGEVWSAGTPVPMQFDGVNNFIGLGGFIQSAVAISDAAQSTKIDLELWLFNSTVVVDTDNSAFTPTDTEMLTLVGIIPFPVASWKAGDATSGAGGNAACVVSGLNIVANYPKLYGVFVVRNTYTPVSGEKLTVRLGIVQEYSGG